MAASGEPLIAWGLGNFVKHLYLYITALDADTVLTVFRDPTLIFFITFFGLITLMCDYPAGNRRLEGDPQDSWYSILLEVAAIYFTVYLFISQCEFAMRRVYGVCMQATTSEAMHFGTILKCSVDVLVLLGGVLYLAYQYLLWKERRAERRAARLAADAEEH